MSAFALLADREFAGSPAEKRALASAERRSAKLAERVAKTHERRVARLADRDAKRVRVPDAPISTPVAGLPGAARRVPSSGGSTPLERALTSGKPVTPALVRKLTRIRRECGSRVVVPFAAGTFAPVEFSHADAARPDAARVRRLHDQAEASKAELRSMGASGIVAARTRSYAQARADESWQGAKRPSVEERHSVSAKRPHNLPTQVKGGTRKLRRMAATILEGEAPRTVAERADAVANGEKSFGVWYPVTVCSQCPHQAAVAITVMQRESGAMSWGGLMRCGSVWLCAECAQKIEQVRGDEVCRAIETARARGYVVVMVTHTFPHKVADSCRDSMDGLAEAMRRMRGTRAYDQFRKSIGYVVLARGTEVTHGRNGWHPHVHEVWFLDPARATVNIGDMTQAQLESTIADAVFPCWERTCGKVFGPDRLPSREHGLDVSQCWSANDYLAKLPDRAAKLEEEGRTRWGPSAEATKTTAKKGRRGSRTFWDILPIASGEGPTVDEQKAAGQVPMTPERGRALVLDYARGTWRKRRMYYSPSRTAKDGTHVPGLRELFDLGVELTDEQIAAGELPMTEDQASDEREKADPAKVRVDLDLVSLAAIGRSYVDALQDRLAPTVARDVAGKPIIVDGRPKLIPVPLVPLLIADGWRLRRAVDPIGEHDCWEATHPAADDRDVEVVSCTPDEPPTAHLPRTHADWCPF